MTASPSPLSPHLARVFTDLRERERRMRDLIAITGLLPCGSTPGRIVFRGPPRWPSGREIEIAFYSEAAK